MCNVENVLNIVLNLLFCFLIVIDLNFLDGIKKIMKIGVNTSRFGKVWWGKIW